MLHFNIKRFEGGTFMQKFVPYEKLSKKKQRELNKKQRGSWGGLNPVSRKVESAKIYNRKKRMVL